MVAGLPRKDTLPLLRVEVRMQTDRHLAPIDKSPQSTGYNTRLEDRSRKPSAVLTIVSRIRYTDSEACLQQG